MWLSLLLSAVMQVSAPGFTTGQPLTVLVEDVRDAKGHVRVELCTAETFLSGHCEIVAETPAVKGTTAVLLADVPAGTYAIQAYQDRNDNRTVDRNALGVPTEGVGFSRHPLLGLHGPRFSKASFVHESAPQTVRVKLLPFF